MRYGAAALLIFLLAGNIPNVSAEPPVELPQELQLEWEFNFGDVYVSTKPLIADQTLFVRTSTSNPNSNFAAIHAFDLEGNQIWSKQNPNSTLHDMSPINYFKEGQGDCGAWPNMLVIGWSDGSLEALHPQTGDVFWHQDTDVITWGITGSMLFNTDQIIVPTRTGLSSFCLSDGSNIFELQTGLGWRNGVSKHGDEFFIGDESGTLWKVFPNGTTTSKFLDIGKIRHAPVVIGDRLLIHGQGNLDSKIALIDPATFSVEIISISGTSPGIPAIFDQTLITIDSKNVKMFDCSADCIIIDQYSFTSNGELSLIFDSHIMLPRNTAEGGWGLFSFNDSSGLEFLEIFSTQYDWYGTAAPEYKIIDDKIILVVGNDNGILQLFSNSNNPDSQEELFKSSYQSQILTFIIFIFIATSGIQFLRENFQSALKYFLVVFVMLSIFAFNDIVSIWASFVDDLNEQPKTQDSLWQEEWPEDWLGTQIVIIEFDNQTLVSGGNVGSDTALELTYEAAQRLDVTVEVSDTSIGEYVQSFNGHQGEGWIYFIDGIEAIVSAEHEMISNDSIVHWKMI